MRTNRLVKIIKRIVFQKSYIKIKILDVISPLLSDKKYLELKFPLCTGYKLNFDNPETYNEKLQWLKLHNRKPEYVMMVDKYDVKQYIASIIGNQYVIPTFAVYDKVDEIDLKNLPSQFVLKCTHDSGGIVICKDKSEFDSNLAFKKLRKGLKRNYYVLNREWPYKKVKPRIIAEQYMEDETGELRDYKFFCFDGEVKALFIASDRSKQDEETKFDFFDADFNHLPIINGHPNADIIPQKPVGYEEMKILASKLSKGIPHVRIDFYDIKGRIYFGEITFFHWSGMKPFEPIEWDYIFGKWIKLPKQIHR